MLYLDHAATTPLAPEVLEAMMPYLKSNFANPSSVYSIGRENQQALSEARQQTAEILGVESDEIIFTSGGTESCNLAIFGIAKSRYGKTHIITTKIEHSAILKSCERLEQEGYEVTHLDVTPEGLVDPASLRSAIRPETALVSIMYANNEIGTVQPISELASIAHEFGIPFHTDACQAAGYLPLKISDLGVDALTLNAGKIYGPKGAGLLYLSSALSLVPQIYGGEQESGHRSGTENLPAIIGLAKALELSEQQKATEGPRLTRLRDLAVARLTSEITGITLNGHATERIANNINISIDGIEGESALIRLDQLGIFVSTGSACSSQNIEPSHVLQAIGRSRNDTHSSLRISLGRSTTQKDVDTFIDALKKIVGDLRSIGI